MRGVLRFCQVRCGQGDLDRRLFFFLLCRHLLACIVSTRPNAVYMDACRLQLVGLWRFFPPVDFQTVSRRTNTQTHDMHERHVCVQTAPVSDITTHTHNIVNMHVQVSLV